MEEDAWSEHEWDEPDYMNTPDQDQAEPVAPQPRAPAETPPTESSREPTESSKEPTGSPREPMESPGEPAKSQREPTESLREPPEPSIKYVQEGNAQKTLISLSTNYGCQDYVNIPEEDLVTPGGQPPADGAVTSMGGPSPQPIREGEYVNAAELERRGFTTFRPNANGAKTRDNFRKLDPVLSPDMERQGWCLVSNIKIK